MSVKKTNKKVAAKKVVAKKVVAPKVAVEKVAVKKAAAPKKAAPKKAAQKPPFTKAQIKKLIRVKSAIAEAVAGEKGVKAYNINGLIVKVPAKLELTIDRDNLTLTIAKAATV